MKKWKLIRIGLIVLVAVGSLFTPLEMQERSPIDWTDLAIIFALIPVGLLFVVGIHAANPLSAKVWEKPDWDRNFLNFKDPVQFFHFGAFVMVAQGVATLCRVLFSNVHIYPETLLPLVMGVSTLLGVHITMLVFRAKFKEST